MALQIKVTEIPGSGRPLGSGLDVEALILKIYYEAPKGLTQEKLATFLGICEASFYNYKKDNVDFLEAVKHYQRISPIEVLKSFKKICVGYEYDETHKELKKNPKTKVPEMVVTKVITKMVKPDGAAAFNYLKNQMSEEFKEKVETVITPGAGMESITFTAKRRG